MSTLTGKLYHLNCDLITGKESASTVSEDLPEVNRQQLRTLVTQDLAAGIKLPPTSQSCRSVRDA